MTWLIVIGMTAAVAAVLLAPVLRRRKEDDSPGRPAFDRAVYRDQLAELERDEAAGVIGATEAGAARNEISRRLLQADSQEGPAGRFRTRPQVASLGVALVAAVALPLYMQRGSPGYPDIPLAARLDKAVANQDFDAMIAKVEKHMGERPNDAQGWIVLAPAYKREGRWNDAATAYANILRLTDAGPEVIADYGEMVVFANEGMVTAEARRALAEALRRDPKLPKARFFDAIALKQEGKRDAALAAFKAFLADTPAEASWRPALEAELASLEGTAPAVDEITIRGMVDGLEARLATDGDDLEGWRRLIRARTVLKEEGKAKAALASARKRFKDRPEALSALMELERELGI